MQSILQSSDNISNLLPDVVRHTSDVTLGWPDQWVGQWRGQSSTDIYICDKNIYLMAMTFSYRLGPQRIKPSTATMRLTFFAERYQQLAIKFCANSYGS